MQPVIFFLIKYTDENTSDAKNKNRIMSIKHKTEMLFVLLAHDSTVLVAENPYLTTDSASSIPNKTNILVFIFIFSLKLLPYFGAGEEIESY